MSADKSTESTGLLKDIDEVEEAKPASPSYRALVLAQLSLLAISVVMVLARSVDYVLYIRMATKMVNYEFILSSILLSLGFNAISWPVVFFKTYVTKSITPEMRAFPGYKFIVMGILDSLGNLISTIPAAFVSGPVNVVMAQSIVLINMVASFLFLRMRFSIFHYIGVLLVCTGIAIKIYPSFIGQQQGNPWFWILLLLISNIPQAASNVYKEKYLKAAHLDVWYLNAWVALWQFLFGLVSFPIVFVPLPPPASYVKPELLVSYFVNGMKCFVGINSMTHDKCDYFFVIFIIFLCFNITYNILILIVFQRGSSTLAVVASAARLVLSSFGFLIPFLAGEATTHNVLWNDYVALAILILGIIFYSIRKEYPAAPTDYLVRFESFVWGILEKIFCFWRKKPEPKNEDEYPAPINAPLH